MDGLGVGSPRGLGWLVVLTLLLGAAALPGSASTATAAASKDHARACRVLRLTGLTVSVAHAHAAKADCRVRLAGAKVEQAGVQTVGRQRLTAPRHGGIIVLWVNPLCEGMPEHEPVLTPGPTELITGLFSHFEGRPRPGVTPRHTTGFWSEPECHIVDAPVAGSITITNEAGVVVALEPLAEGQLATIPLPPGKYTILGTFAHDHEEGEKPAHSFPTPVTIITGRTVRQDVSPKGPNE